MSKWRSISYCTTCIIIALIFYKCLMGIKLLTRNESNKNFQNGIHRSYVILLLDASTPTRKK
jgi:hypothetical protein